MDYAAHLVLYSGGADSTYFIAREKTATHLIHYRGSNQDKTLVAQANAARFGRWLFVERFPRSFMPPDGEINQIHALSDTLMALQASLTAATFGMKGIVLCFNQDDLGLDADALKKIMNRAVPGFDVATPLAATPAATIRAELKSQSIPYVSCMVSGECGKCPKCLRGY